MKIIKAKFLKDGQPHGRDYTYYSEVPVVVDDLILLPLSKKGIVTQVDVDEKEIESFKDKVKTIIGKVEVNEESV